MLCKKLHHAAYRCKDAAETVRFYTCLLYTSPSPRD